MRTWCWYSKVLFGLLVAAFAYLVWPTPWQYGDYKGLPIRTHRVTGRVQSLAQGLGWQPFEYQDPFARLDARKRWRERGK